MKLSLAQLRKLPMPYSFKETVDLSESLNGLEDIVEAKECNVVGKLIEVGNDTYELHFNLKIELVIEDSISLELIPYTVESEADELYSTDESYSDATIIENQTLDTTEAYITSILVEKPSTYSNYKYENDVDTDDEPDDKINPAFASLKDLL